MSKANKRADDLFLKANHDIDNVIEEEEFGDIIKQEYAKRDRMNFRYSEQTATIDRKIKTSRCSYLNRLMRLCRKKTKGKRDSFANK